MSISPLSAAILLRTTFFSVGLVELRLADIDAVEQVLYGAGNGLRAIVHGTLPLAMTKPESYAIVVGRMARPALLGQALTPLIGEYVFERMGASAILWPLCGLAIFNVVLVMILKQRLPAVPADIV